MAESKIFLDVNLREISEQTKIAQNISYSGKFSREKTFTNFVVLEPPAKVFSTKIGCAVP